MRWSKNFLLVGSVLLISSVMSGILFGCGGGGGDANNGNTDIAQTVNLQLNKTDFNFGNVTLGNAATVSVIISNTGTRNLSIESITLSENNNFTIDPGECGTDPYSIAAGTSCSVNATFAPIVEGSFSETLTIVSEDENNPTATVSFTGEGTALSAYSVALNQVETDCSTHTVTAYVSVADQEGFAVTDLAFGDFSIIEDGVAPIVPDSVDFVDNTSSPLSVAILMDYSGSVYQMENLTETIENSVASFVEAMGAADQSEIIKFATLIQRTQDFTADKALLDAAIYQVPTNIGSDTALYDAIYQGIDDAAQTQTTRRAVLVLTDGRNDVDVTVHPLQEGIELGIDLGVPVFTVGVGNYINVNVLNQIASETGGQFFDSPDTDRLLTIYSQLSNILKNQYIVTYTAAGTGNTVVRLQHATAAGGTISSDSNALPYPSCP
jgi:VWFA-related protein